MNPILVVGGASDGSQVLSDLPTIRLFRGGDMVSRWDGSCDTEFYNLTTFRAEDGPQTVDLKIYKLQGMSDADVVRSLISSHSKNVFIHT